MSDRPREANTLLEGALRHERAVTSVLVLVTVASWTWIVLMARDMYGTMRGASAWMMTTQWDIAHVLLLWAMWAVMMTAMMLPSAAPLVLLYAAALHARHIRHATASIWALGGGYLIVWGLFSAVATALQRILTDAVVLTPMMEPYTPQMAAIVLALAGVYQLTPLKRACLHVCRSPLAYLLQRWRTGLFGALRLGIEHGVYCLGCCWALMVVLLALGAMSVVPMLILAVVVITEKLWSKGEAFSRLVGVACLVLAAGTIWFPGLAPGFMASTPGM